MKITIIGGGNMGGAIARGLVAKGIVPAASLTVSDPSQDTRDAFAAFNPAIKLSADNAEAVKGADLVIIAVKPWLMEPIAAQVAPTLDARTMVASIAAGITFAQLETFFAGRAQTFFRIIPNTAISLGQSVTFIASHGATPGQTADVARLFDALGKVFVIDEAQMTACTALASCGIAYALRYIDASAKGGVDMGVDQQTSLEIVRQTMAGALALLEANGSQPQQEIDKVTTPGGITLKGLAEMERQGFSQAVIDGLKASR